MYDDHYAELDINSKMALNIVGNFGTPEQVTVEFIITHIETLFDYIIFQVELKITLK